MPEQESETSDTRPQRLYISLQSTEPTVFGRGWISGVLSVVLGIIGLGAVVCFHFPSWLTMPELRVRYPLTYVRAVLHLVLVAAFLMGVISICLRQNKALGLTGILLTLIAAILGGSRVPIDGELRNGPFLGLDWFLLNLILYSAVYIPLERLFAKHPEQPTFRPGWRTDVVYFFVSSLLVQVTTLLTLTPATVLFRWAIHPVVHATVSSLPFFVQFVGVLLVADLTQYWVHRLFHTVPWLWRFHAIHHSAEAMDWLAGSRLHLVDAVLTRGLTYVPIFVSGFSESAMFAYAVFVSIQATFIHANVRWELSPIHWLVATPRFHHWHHSAEREAIDKNFSVHLPFFDWLFGTYFMPPRRWPASYGIGGSSDVPKGYLQQLVYPFMPERANDSPPTQ